VKKQCPDFCSGIAGHLRIVCDKGRCVQVSNLPKTAPKSP
jgi:hypothetical protein